MKKIYIFLVLNLLYASFIHANNDLYLSNSDTLKVLAIGNSFSEDAIQYFYDLAKAEKKHIIVGNMFYSGCSLAQHWSFITNKSAVYDYQKNVSGVFSHLNNSTFLKGLLDECWDVISFQQYSGDSGLINTYFPYLDYIINYVKQNATNPNVKFALHQTWAYPDNSKSFAFSNYGKDQLEMYKKIISSVEEAAEKENITLIIPSGTAIQNGRGYFGDVLNRDDLHLSIPLGRYIASCAWFEALFGENSIGNAYRPEGISCDIAIKAQEAAHAAIMKRVEITNISQYSEIKNAYLYKYYCTPNSLVITDVPSNLEIYLYEFSGTLLFYMKTKVPSITIPVKQNHTYILKIQNITKKIYIR